MLFRSVGEALARRGHRLHHAARVELAHHDIVDEVVWLLDLVGLDATDEMGLGLLESLHQVVERDSERVDDAYELGALEAACPGLKLGLWFLFEERETTNSSSENCIRTIKSCDSGSLFFSRNPAVSYVTLPG